MRWFRKKNGQEDEGVIVTTQTNVINNFSGNYAFLSNFSRHAVSYEGFYCPTAEHAFQLAKAETIREKLYVANAPTPSEAKRRGRTVVLRQDWEAVKDRVMTEILLVKFLGSPELCRALVSTYPADLVEGNTWGDRYWGVDSRTGEGRNVLGNLLMDIRHTARAIQAG